MLQFNEVKELILAANAGDQIEVFCEGRHVRPLSEEIPGLTWKQVTIGHFIFTVPEPPMKSGKTLLFEMLEKYDSGFLKLDISENSARVYVSQFNKANDTKFKVTMREGVPHVYGEMKHRKFIRMSEYTDALYKAIEELNRLRSMVRPDEYFEMAKPDYDNKMPPVTAADFDSEASDNTQDDGDGWNIPKRGIVYVCDDCGEIVPAEQGEVDVCASCQEARDNELTQEEPSNDTHGMETVPQEALKAYDCRECGEELLAYEHEPKLCDMCIGIE